MGFYGVNGGTTNSNGYGGRKPVFANGRKQADFLSPRRQWRMINDGTNTTGWTAASGGTRAVTSISDKRGRTISAMKMTATAANTTTNLDYTITGEPFSNYEAIVFDMYVDFQTWSLITGASTGGTAAFLLGDAAFTNFWTWQVNVTMGWNRIVLHPSNITATTGSPAWTTAFFAAASTLRFRIQAQAGYTGTFYISNFAFVGQTLKRALLRIDTDDARRGFYQNIWPYMKARGIVCSIGVIGDQIGNTAGGYMLASEIREMVAGGCSVRMHSDTHGAAPFLIGASEATVNTEYADCDAAMLANGLNSYGGAYGPFGEWDTNIFASMKNRGVKSYRGLINANGFKTSPLADHLPAGCLVPCTQIVDGTSAATALTWIDGAINTKSMQILLMHDVLAVGSASPPVIATSVAQTLMDGIETRMKAGTLDVVNADQWDEIGGLRYCAVGYP